MAKKDKYLQIFNYLLEFSKIRSNPVRDIDAQEAQYPEKFWLCDIPKDDLFDSVLHADYNNEAEYWIKVQKPKEPIKPDFPKISSILELWINRESLLDEENGPILHERIQDGEEFLELQDFPDVQETFDKYVNEKWLDDLIEHNSKLDIYQQEYKVYERLNETYKFFFKIHNKAQQFGEEYELIIGIGLLNFKENEECPKVFRHVLTQKVDVSFEYSQRDSVIKVLPNIESDIQIETDSIVDLFDQFDSANIIDAEKSVQGPPGTGKSHTIANLICHLLANGKKVLVTAYTQRALEILKDKLPDEFQNLTVNLLSGDSSSIQDLQASVNAINDELSRANLKEYEKNISYLSKEKLKGIRESIASKTNELISIQEKSTRKQSINKMYEGTLLEIAEQLEQDAEKYAWYQDMVNDVQNLEILDDVKQFIQQVKYYQNIDCSEFEYELPEPDQLISVDKLKTYKSKANELLSYYTAKNEHVSISSQDYSELKILLTHLLEVVREIDLINLLFKNEVIENFFNNRQSQWTQKIQRSDKVFQTINGFDLDQIDRDIEIQYLQDKSIKQLKHDAQTLLSYLKEGNALSGFLFKLKKAILPTEIKEKLYFIDNVLVNGSPCDTTEEFETVINDLELKQDFEELAIIWGESTDNSKFSHQRNYYANIRENTTKLLKLLTESTDLKSKIAAISSLKIKGISKSEIEDLIFETEYNQLLRAMERFKEEINKSKSLLPDANVHPLKRNILKSFENIDPQSYKSCLQELTDAKERLEKYKEYKTLEIGLKDVFPELLTSIHEGVFGEHQIPELNKAIHYGHARSEISRLLSNQYEDKLAREIKALEQREKQVLSTLASKKAWLKVLEGLNKNRALRQHLQAWVQAVKRIGKTGRGKRALKFRKEAQVQMEKCKSSVPCWIMPLYKVAETIQPKQEMYDYIIIDEASQLGPDAIFLLYISKNIIIVGDDKQTSPEYVGVSADTMKPHIHRHLQDIPFANFYGTEFSFFDHANRFCDGMIVLREHFRCMPEIIEFSNKHFYLPDGTGLYPLKQYSEKRLDPIKTVFCDSGFTEGRFSKIINRPEAEKMVETIAKLVGDEKYEDKTFGVIVLQGNQQAALIENLLLKAIGETKYHNRKIVCGNSASFQGDERDIIFLSLITAHNHNRSALTRAEDERRFNVAVSRAKEQIWLFHSIHLEDLSNTNDLRYKLLDHCLNLNGSASQSEKSELINVPKNKERGTQPYPFDSWFEVEVYNDIVSKGYSVIPQYEVARGKYRIDLVALLPDGTKIAIECDGDAYHGPDQFQNDIMRQKVLERCGWQFFRVRGVEYYTDRKKALEPLWNLLPDLSNLNQSDHEEVEPEEVFAETEEQTPKSTGILVGARQKRRKLSSSIQNDLFRNESQQSIDFNRTAVSQSAKSVIKSANKTSLFDYRKFLIFTNESNIYKLQNNGVTSRQEILNRIAFDEGERPIYITGTTDYSGFLLTGFENGKIAKVFLESFRTQSNRKRLKNAYNSDSKLVFIEHIENEFDLIAISTIDKIMLFNTGDISPKSSTKSSGVQVLKAKGNSKLKAIKKTNQVEFNDLEYYRKNIPATGNYLLRHDSY
jgi:superfamily I DNA and/or RNA helicase/very-short-patch-repair endonuclease